MAGTDRKQVDAAANGARGPAIILVAPQLGENIGTAARAMYNFGLTDLRLVQPRDGWPNERARAASSGADRVIDQVRVFETTAEAVSDLHLVFATTARPRDMAKAVFSPPAAAVRMRHEAEQDRKVGVLFGPERTGLHNDDVVLADAILSVPVNPAFASLNLAQAVLLMAYEWFKLADEGRAGRVEQTLSRPATKQEIVGFFEHLEGALDQAGFLRPVEKRPAMVRNLRNLFQRAGLSEQDVATLRGIVAALTRRVPKGQGPDVSE